jgi:hypothetical protein
MCSRVCDQGACVAGECLRAGAVPAVEGRDRFGLYQARRLVLEPVEAVRLGPGDLRGEVSRVVTLGRERDAASVLLLRFAVDLPPDTIVLEAHVVLERVQSVPADPQPIALHAARIVDPWGARSITWGRAPRLDDARLPVTTLEEAGAAARVDVVPLVRRWRGHATDDHGIAIVADRVSATGMAFAMADGSFGFDETPLLPVRTLADSPPTFFAAAPASAGSGEPAAPRGPRLELYVRP